MAVASEAVVKRVHNISEMSQNIEGFHCSCVAKHVLVQIGHGYSPSSLQSPEKKLETKINVLQHCTFGGMFIKQSRLRLAGLPPPPDAVKCNLLYSHQNRTQALLTPPSSFTLAVEMHVRKIAMNIISQPCLWW